MIWPWSELKKLREDVLNYKRNAEFLAHDRDRERDTARLYQQLFNCVSQEEQRRAEELRSKRLAQILKDMSPDIWQ